MFLEQLELAIILIVNHGSWWRLLWCMVVLNGLYGLFLEKWIRLEMLIHIFFQHLQLVNEVENNQK